MLPLIRDALTAQKVKQREPVFERNMWRIRIGGFDARRVMFKGWVELEPFKWRDVDGSFCVMQRDQVRVWSFRVQGCMLTEPRHI